MQAELEAKCHRRIAGEEVRQRDAVVVKGRKRRE